MIELFSKIHHSFSVCVAHLILKLAKSVIRSWLNKSASSCSCSVLMRSRLSGFRRLIAAGSLLRRAGILGNWLGTACDFSFVLWEPGPSICFSMLSSVKCKTHTYENLVGVQFFRGIARIHCLRRFASTGNLKAGRTALFFSQVSKFVLHSGTQHRLGTKTWATDRLCFCVADLCVIHKRINVNLTI